MRVTVNGEARTFPPKLTMRAFLKACDLGPDEKGIAVAVNATVISRSEWESFRLADGDRVDVIRAVQGG